MAVAQIGSSLSDFRKVAPDLGTVPEGASIRISAAFLGKKHLSAEIASTLLQKIGEAKQAVDAGGPLPPSEVTAAAVPVTKCENRGGMPFAPGPELA